MDTPVRYFFSDPYVLRVSSMSTMNNHYGPFLNYEDYDHSKCSHDDYNNFCSSLSAIRAIVENDENQFNLALGDSDTSASAFRNAPIRKAAELGRVQMLQTLLRSYEVDPCDNNNEAVFLAVIGGHLEALKRLINDRRIWWCPLHAVCLALARENNHTDIVEYIEGFDHVAYHHKLDGVLFIGHPVGYMERGKRRWRLRNSGDFANSECFVPYEYLSASMDIPEFFSFSCVDTYLSDLNSREKYDLTSEFHRFIADNQAGLESGSALGVSCIR